MEQDVEKWKRELKEAGWRPYRYRGHDYAYMWVAPYGEIYRGPYFAWTLMQSFKQWPCDAPDHPGCSDCLKEPK